MLKTIKVNLKTKENRSYSVIIGKGMLNNVGRDVKKLKIGKNIFIITDSIVEKLYAKQIINSFKKAGFKDIGLTTIPSGEESKSFRNFIKIQAKLYDFDTHQDKKVIIVALGGGVVGDLGGFVAATYKRGVSYIQIPTTLLGQVDCGLGGKTAINFKEAKNSIGAFWQPKLVCMDINVLKTLSQRELKSGLAEVIKYGIIKDLNLFKYLEKNIKDILNYSISSFEHVIPICVKIKSSITSLDERDEKDIRIILNYGHTAGHAIESATNYKFYKHGEAIAIGMIIAAEIALELKLFKIKDLLRIENLIKKAGLPIRMKEVPLDSIIESIKRDKKFVGGTNKFVLPVEIGKCKVVKNINEKMILNVIKKRM